MIAYRIRPHVTDEINRRYFFPALTVKIFGALALGFIYQFYYSGGDTFNYHIYGSRIIWEAFWDSPIEGLNIFFRGSGASGIYDNYSRIAYYFDPSSYTVVQIAFLCDLFTFSTYSGTAVLFAIISFLGSWLMFQTFYLISPELHKWLAFSVLFIPSVIYWGSGILKDTITFSCIGIAVYSTHYLFIEKKIRLSRILMLIISLMLLYHIKIYILLALLPMIILWVFFVNLTFIKNKSLRILLMPLVVGVSITLAVFAPIKAGEDNPKYSINSIAKTAQITAYDIRYYTGKNAGSGYSLGELDGSFNSLIKLAPVAINVSLFRPYLWEVNNVLMLLSALESSIFFILTFLLLIRNPIGFVSSLRDPNILFCLIFSLIFAFAVGVSTYNFGTLVRYKIPMMPFYAIGLSMISQKLRKI